MRNRIKVLAEQARALEPDAAERAVFLAKVGQYAETFLTELPQAPAYLVTADEGRGLFDSPISEEPIELDAALALLNHNVDQPGVNPASSRLKNRCQT